MTLIKFKPANSKLYDNMNHMIKTVFNDDWSVDYNTEIEYPLDIEVNETDKSIFINADIPGLTKKDIAVEIVNNTLLISGERKNQSKIENDGYHYCERKFGTFNRSFKLPDSVNEKEVSATFKNGILKIELQKHKSTPPIKRQIKVN